MVLLDVVINNADRKSGHVIIEESMPPDAAQLAIGPGRLWGIDHGICLHHEYKLRTVIWEFAGTAIPQALLADLQGLGEQLAGTESALRVQLQSLLTAEEISACQKRIRTLTSRGKFPNPGPGRHYPWPPV